MHPAFHPSVPLLLRRVSDPLPHQRPHAQPALDQQPATAITTCATPHLRPLRNLAVLAAAAVALHLPAAAAAAPPVTPLSPATAAKLSPAQPQTITTALRPRAPVLAAASAPAPVTIADRLGFWAGEFLMWNPAAKVLALLACTLVCMYLGSFLYRMADPEGKEAASPFWHSVRAIANPLEDDWEKNSLRTTSIALAGIGMIVFAIMVGMVTEAVASAVENVDGDMSRVIVSDHILVCGWSPHVSQIIKDVNSVASHVKVVVLAAPEYKQRMMDHMRQVLSEEERGRLRVFYRPGAPIAQEDLDRVAASRASKIILVNSRSGDLVDADRRILSRALALQQNLPFFKGDIVAELNTVRDEGILKSILANSRARSVETVNAEQLLFRFMAQAIRQPGLADVVADLMGDDPSTVFHVRKAQDVAPQLVGANLADLRPTSVPGSVLCGFYDKNGNVHIGPGLSVAIKDPKLNADTDLLLLGIKGASRKASVSSNPALPAVSRSTAARMEMIKPNQVKQNKRGTESFLICGWRDDMHDMFAELDAVLAPGSKITILDEDVPDTLTSDLKNLAVTCIRKRPDRYENLQELLGPKCKPFDHVVLLGSVLGNEQETRSRMAQEEDTKTLASLVYVNELLSKQYDANPSKGINMKNTMVTVEFINERVAKMAKEQGNVTNAILPQNLSAKIAAQTVRDSRLNDVWRELLSQRGREVYLRPCSAYADVGDEHFSFAALADRLAKTCDDVVIGYIPHDGRVIINPKGQEKFNTRAWDRRDVVIVLSED